MNIMIIANKIITVVILGALVFYFFIYIGYRLYRKTNKQYFEDQRKFKINLMELEYLKDEAQSIGNHKQVAILNYKIQKLKHEKAKQSV